MQLRDDKDSKLNDADKAKLKRKSFKAKRT